MSDFHQTGVITALHRLGATDLPRLEGELLHYAKERPIALVLPSLFSETRGPALKGIIEQLGQVRYLKQVVVSLSGAAAPDEFREMRALLQDIRCLEGGGATVVWSDGPRVRDLLDQLRAEGLDPGPDGKGRATWLAYGYVLATQQARVVATHDCDILGYSSRQYVTSTNMNFQKLAVMGVSLFVSKGDDGNFALYRLKALQMKRSFTHSF